MLCTKRSQSPHSQRTWSRLKGLPGCTLELPRVTAVWGSTTKTVLQGPTAQHLREPRRNLHSAPTLDLANGNMGHRGTRGPREPLGSRLHPCPHGVATALLSLGYCDKFPGSTVTLLPAGSMLRAPSAHPGPSWLLITGL